MTRTALVTVVCLMAFVPCARAQTPLRTTLGGQPGERLGWSLANYDDVDGDGVREYVAFHTRGARLYRGSDGAELGDYLRAAGLIGDIDGDGRSDFYSFDFDGFSGVLLPVDVLSGANGAVLASYPWEYGGNATWNQPSPLDDINGDGVGDFLRSEWDFSTGAFLERVAVVSGANGSVLRAHQDRASVTSVGDANGDGVADYYLGEYGAGPGQLISGANGAVLATANPASGPTIGLSAIADVDGDGVLDLARVIVATPSVIGAPPGLSTEVVGSVSGLVLRAFDGQPVTPFGAPAAHGDFDGDGSLEIVMRDGAALVSVARNIASGAVVATYESLGFAGLGVGDSDNDGRDELLLARSTAVNKRGKLQLVQGSFSERVGTASAFGDGSSGPCPCTNGAAGEGCENSLGRGAKLSAWGSASLAARDLTFRGQGVWTNQAALGRQFLLAGFNLRPTPIPLGAGLLALAFPFERIASSNRETADWDAALRPEWSTWTAGQTLHFQVWYVDPDVQGNCGFSSNLSNALSVTFTP